MISVAMATYNGEQFLQEQLDSIFNQNYSDIEIIVCDDCSTDGTWALLKQNEEKDSRLHCYRNSSNLGFKKNFEKAISLCKGDYIALSDQDDIWEKEHLKKLLDVIGDNDIACGDAVLIDGDGREIGMSLSEADYFYDCSGSSLAKAYRIFYGSSCFQGASMLIRAIFLKKALPIPQDVLYHDTWFAALACFSKGLHYEKFVITRHRIHGKNASHRPHWRSFLKLVHLKKNRERVDRVPLAAAIQERIADISSVQKAFLEYVPKYRDNIRTLRGKISNVFFRLRHYHDIYTTNRKIFIEW